MAKNVLEVIITATDKASKQLGGLTDKLGGLAKGAGIAGAAVVAAGTAVGIGAFKMAEAAAPVEQVQKTFDNLAASIGEKPVEMMNKLREATRGMVSDADLMQAANKLMSMGLADSADEAARLAEMATQLGSAMGTDATTSMEDFALMLANQSIPRLDTFGISSGQVRTRIEELMAADSSLTREQAFMTATLELGAVAMERVGEQSGTAGASMATLKAQMDNLKISIGTALLPILSSLATSLTPVITSLQPGLTDAAAALGGIFASDVVPVIGRLAAEILPLLVSLLPPIVNLFGALANSLISALVPILEPLIGFIVEIIDLLMPVISSLLPPLIELINAVFSILVALLPAITSIISAVMPIITTILPPLIKLLTTVTNAIANLVGWLVDKLKPAFDAIGNAVEKVMGWFGKLIDKLGKIKLPDWLTPGSPTPFELGLLGIADALQEVNDLSGATFGGLTVNPVSSAPGSSAASRGPISLAVHIHTPINLADRSFAEKELMPYIEAGVRQLLARSA